VAGAHGIAEVVDLGDVEAVPLPAPSDDTGVGDMNLAPPTVELWLCNPTNCGSAAAVPISLVNGLRAIAQT
jgi:hypothetical protein